MQSDNTNELPAILQQVKLRLLLSGMATGSDWAVSIPWTKSTEPAGEDTGWSELLEESCGFGCWLGLASEASSSEPVGGTSWCLAVRRAVKLEPLHWVDASWPRWELLLPGIELKWEVLVTWTWLGLETLVYGRGAGWETLLTISGRNWEAWLTATSSGWLEVRTEEDSVWQERAFFARQWLRCLLKPFKFLQTLKQKLHVVWNDELVTFFKEIKHSTYLALTSRKGCWWLSECKWEGNCLVQNFFPTWTPLASNMLQQVPLLSKCSLAFFTGKHNSRCGSHDRSSAAFLVLGQTIVAGKMRNKMGWIYYKVFIPDTLFPTVANMKASWPCSTSTIIWDLTYWSWNSGELQIVLTLSNGYVLILGWVHRSGRVDKKHWKPDM